MSIDEAIHVLEMERRYEKGILSEGYTNKCPSILVDAFDVAIKELKGKKERKVNEPLTLEELKKMVGKPILLETGEVSTREQLICGWEILVDCESDAEDDVFFFTRRKRGFILKRYGLTWLAYKYDKNEQKEK